MCSQRVWFRSETKCLVMCEGIMATWLFQIIHHVTLDHNFFFSVDFRKKWLVWFLKQHYLLTMSEGKADHWNIWRTCFTCSAVQAAGSSRKPWWVNWQQLCGWNEEGSRCADGHEERWVKPQAVETGGRKLPNINNFFSFFVFITSQCVSLARAAVLVSWWRSAVIENTRNSLISSLKWDMVPLALCAKRQWNFIIYVIVGHKENKDFNVK